MKPSAPTLIGPDAKLRINNLNTLRLIMALLVVWSHSFAFWYGTEAVEPLSIIFNGLYNAGNIGVLAFFTISGFLIPMSYQRSSSWFSYLKKRIARIYPAYLVCITLCSLIVVPLFSSRRFGVLNYTEILDLSSNLLLRNFIIRSDAFNGTAVNGALWSIPFEFWCYLGVLALGLVHLLHVRALILAGAVAVILGKVALDVAHLRPGGGLIELIIGFPYFWFSVLPPFLLGSAIYGYRDLLPRNLFLLLTLLIVTVVGAHVPLPGSWRGAPASVLFPFMLAYAIFYFGFHPRWHWGDAARHGDFSYGCYLYAFPIQQMLNTVFGGGGPWLFAVYVVLSMMLSLLAGVLSWFLVERWFERKRVVKPRHAVAA